MTYIPWAQGHSHNPQFTTQQAGLESVSESLGPPGPPTLGTDTPSGQQLRKAVRMLRGKYMIAPHSYTDQRTWVGSRTRGSHPGVNHKIVS